MGERGTERKLTISPKAFYRTVMKKEKNTRYNNKPDEVIIYPERVEKKESGQKSFLVQLRSNLRKQETNIWYDYIYV